MKILLAGLGFINGDINYNKNKIINTIKKYSNVDMIVFGEAFLQGFNALCFKYETDINVAISISDDIIKELQDVSKEYQVGVSFGYFEKDGNNIYSSQLTIDKNGFIINNYRRVSVGWKELDASDNYKEGTSFPNFKFLDKNLTVALCGDLWYDENLKILKNINSDIVLWPVYTDFNSDEWNSTIKYEYSSQVKELHKDVLLVNSFRLDGANDEAKGGCSHFKDGLIINEAPSGKEDVLLVIID